MSRAIIWRCSVLQCSLLGCRRAAFGAEALKKIRIASKAPGESLVPYMISAAVGFLSGRGWMST